MNFHISPVREKMFLGKPDYSGTLQPGTRTVNSSLYVNSWQLIVQLLPWPLSGCGNSREAPIRGFGFGRTIVSSITGLDP